MNRYTAKQAKQEAGPTLDENIDSLLDSIKERAEANHRYIKTGWNHKEDQDLWSCGGYVGTEDWKEAKKILENLGYTVKFRYTETQLVDMYTLVEW